MIIVNADKTKTYLQEAGNKKNNIIMLLHGIGADHQMSTVSMQKNSLPSSPPLPKVSMKKNS